MRVCECEVIARSPSSALANHREHALHARYTLCTLHSPHSERRHGCSTAQLLLYCELSEILACLCTQHLPFWVRTRRRVSAPHFSEHFSPCFKLPHATYLTTHDVACGIFRWGACCPLERIHVLSLSHPFWIWSRVSLDIEPLRENQTKITRLLVAQPRAPAGLRAHATNDRLV